MLELYFEVHMDIQLLHIQSITGNKHQIAAHNTPYILGSNTTDVTKTPSTNDCDGGPQHKKLSPQQEHSRQRNPTNKTKP
jgi:hypothetical protein